MSVSMMSLSTTSLSTGSLVSASAVRTPPIADRRAAVALIAMFMLFGLSMNAAAVSGAGDDSGPGCSHVGLAAALGGGAIGARALSKLGGGAADVAQVSKGVAGGADGLVSGAKHLDAVPAGKLGAGVGAAGEAAVDAARVIDVDAMKGFLHDEGPGLLLDVASFAVGEGEEVDTASPRDPASLAAWSDGLPVRIAWARIEGDQLVARVYSSDPRTLLVYGVKGDVPAVNLEAPGADELRTAPVRGPGNVSVPLPAGGDQLVVVVVDQNSEGKVRVVSTPVLVDRAAPTPR